MYCTALPPGLFDFHQSIDLSYSAYVLTLYLAAQPLDSPVALGFRVPIVNVLGGHPSYFCSTMDRSTRGYTEIGLTL